jgi:hypothetical protein
MCCEIHVGDRGIQFGVLPIIMKTAYPNFLTDALSITDLTSIVNVSEQYSCTSTADTAVLHNGDAQLLLSSVVMAQRSSAARALVCIV